MDVKIDTKEKFHVMVVGEPVLTAKLAEELSLKLNDLVTQPVKNVILRLQEVTELDEQAGEILVKTQQKFYEQNASFVVSDLQKPVEEFLDSKSLLELLNWTPTESEAWDIVQMEEIERELLDGGDV